MTLRLMTTVSAPLALLLAAEPAFSAPPEAKPLSEIVRMREDGGDVAYVDEVEWDDRGYWDVEYVRKEGGKVEVRLDPLSGRPKR